MQGIALSERHRGHVRLPRYFNPAVTGPSLLDALKAEFAGVYDIGVADGACWAFRLDRPGELLRGMTPASLAVRIRERIAGCAQ